MFLLGAINVFSPSNTFHVKISELGKRLLLRTGTNPNVATTVTGGATLFNAPDISPAYLGVGYIIGPRLAALNFAGGVLAWGLLVPLLTFTFGPYIQAAQPAGQSISWPLLAGAIYYSIVRPIAVGGMLVGASYTLFKMRKQLGVGMGRAISDLKKSAAAHAVTNRTERDLSAKVVFAGIALVFVAMFLLYHYFIGGAGISPVPHAYRLAGRGRSHDHCWLLLRRCLRQPGRDDRLVEQSRLRVDALHAGDRGSADGRFGSFRQGGVAAVLGVAAVVCVSSAVAGEMLQDLKVGHILGGTPPKCKLAIFSASWWRRWFSSSRWPFSIRSITSARPNCPRRRPV